MSALLTRPLLVGATFGTFGANAFDGAECMTGNPSGVLTNSLANSLEICDLESFLLAILGIMF
jgi:hypothetical protein